MRILLIFSLVLCSLFLAENAGAQNITARLTIKRGSDAYFNINSLYKVSNGVSYTDWVQFEVYYVDTNGVGVDGSSTWDLSARALTANINGDHGNTLDTRTIELTSSDGGGALGAAADYSKIELTNTYQDIVADGPRNDLTDLTKTNLVNLTIDVGKNVDFKLVDEPSDFYTIDIDFLLDEH